MGLSLSYFKSDVNLVPADHGAEVKPFMSENPFHSYTNNDDSDHENFDDNAINNRLGRDMVEYDSSDSENDDFHNTPSLIKKRGDLETYLEDIHPNVNFYDKCADGTQIHLQMSQSSVVMLATQCNDAVKVVHITMIIAFTSLIAELLLTISLANFTGKFSKLRSISLLIPLRYADSRDMKERFVRQIRKYLPIKSDGDKWTVKFLTFKYGADDSREVVVFRYVSADETNPRKSWKEIPREVMERVEHAFEANKILYKSVHLPEGCHPLPTRAVCELLKILTIEPGDTFWEIGAGQCRMAYALSAAAQGGTAVVTEVDSLYELWMVISASKTRNKRKLTLTTKRRHKKRLVIESDGEGDNVDAQRSKERIKSVENLSNSEVNEWL